MKKYIILIATAVLSITSCRSIEKMVNRGDYDSAFAYGADKLRNEKHRSTKNLDAFEKAYRILNTNDLNRIDNILAAPHTHRWADVKEMYMRLDRRNALVSTLLPLRSKEGRSYRFELPNYTTEIADATRKDVAYRFDNAKALVDNARSTKSDYRYAYDQLLNLHRYDPSLYMVNAYIARAQDLGTTYIGIDFDSEVGGQANFIANRALLDFDPHRLSTFWTKYQFVDKRNTNIRYDEKYVIKLDNIDLGMERELVNNIERSREIADGFKYVHDKHGNVVKDTANVAITIPNLVLVKALITEVKREKVSNIQGRLNIYTDTRLLAVRSIPINVQHVFSDMACKWIGDQRALNEKEGCRFNARLSDFPPDDAVINNLSRNFLSEIERIIKSNV